MAYYVPIIPQQVVTPLIAASVPLPPSPFGSPYTSPYTSPYGSPYGSPYSSPRAVLVPLPSSPVVPFVPLVTSHPGTPLSNPLPLPPAAIPSAANPPVTLTTDFLCHPLLALDPFNPKLLWDVRRPPETIRTNKPQPRSLERLDCLNEHAMSPPWTFIRIKCTLLPWIIEYTNPVGVKVGEVLDVLYDFLREPIGRNEWKGEEEDFQGRLLDAWRRRCVLEGEIHGRRARLEEESAGVRRVDWLLWDFEFLGLEYIGQVEPETWVVHFRSR